MSRRGWLRDALSLLTIRVHRQVPAPSSDWERQRRRDRAARRAAWYTARPASPGPPRPRRTRPKRQRREPWVMRWQTRDGQDVVVRGGRKPRRTG